MLKKETTIAVLKQYWYRYQHPTKADKISILLMCIPLACWVFSILGLFQTRLGDNLSGWFWFYWISFFSMVAVFVIGRIWCLYDVIKHMKETGFLVPIDELEGKRS